MKEYLDLLRYVHENGNLKKSRAFLSSGEKPDTRSVFGYQYRIDLRKGFPLLTTKKMPFRLVAEELLWFLSGSSSNADLNARGVTIWDEWAKAGPELGPIYGKQWRRWEGPGGIVVDQIAGVVEGIRKVIADPQDSASRRLIVSAWNPGDNELAARDHLRKYGPVGCHTLFQFYVIDGKLSCHLYQRSADLLLGVPWNIASYALLTHILAKVTGLEAHEFVHSFGDVHIYMNHIDQVEEQLGRDPLPLPRLEIDDTVNSVDGLSSSQFRLIDYRSHPPIKGEVAV